MHKSCDSLALWGVNQALALLTHPEGRHGDGPQLFQPVKILLPCCQDHKHVIQGDVIQGDIIRDICLLQTLDSPMFQPPLTSLAFIKAPGQHDTLRI